MRKKPAVYFLIVLIILGSCATGVGKKEDQLLVYLTDSSRFVLLPAAGIEKALDMPQFLSASYGGEDYFLNVWVMADENGIDMTLFNGMGSNMGELSYRDGSVSFSSPVFPPSLLPEYIVADFQLCFYRADILRRALKNCGLILETTDTGRRILKGKNLITEIEKKPESVKLTNHLRGYSYTLEGNFSVKGNDDD